LNKMLKLLFKSAKKVNLVLKIKKSQIKVKIRYQNYIAIKLTMIRFKQ
jgi:hypothetical protein